MRTFDAGAIYHLDPDSFGGSECCVIVTLTGISCTAGFGRCGDIVDLTRDQTALSRASCHADCSTSSLLLTATVSIRACSLFHHRKMSSNNQLPPIDPLSGSHQIPVPWCATWKSCFLLLPLRQHHFCFKQCTTNKGLGSSERTCMANTSAFNDKGSEKWGVDEIVARDEKLASNSCSQLNK